MTSQQQDAVQRVLSALDEFAHAFGQDFPTKTVEVEQFAASLANWATHPVEQ